MTQAWNLSQLGNNVNASGQLDASTGLVNAAPVANGGTNNAALAVTSGGVIYSDGSKLVNVGAGTTGQSLTSQGASPPIWSGSGYSGVTLVTFIASGSFVVPSGITRIFVDIEGGGGGAGGAQFSGSIGGAGGRGGQAGAYITGASGTYAITIGAGGIGATSSVAATAGGTTSFGTAVSATGGGGGISNQSGATGASGAAGTTTVSTGTSINNGSATLVGTYGNGAPSTPTGGASFANGANGVAGIVNITY